jgi:hypothetical protein
MHWFTEPWQVAAAERYMIALCGLLRPCDACATRSFSVFNFIHSSEWYLRYPLISRSNAVSTHREFLYLSISSQPNLNSPLSSLSPSVFIRNTKLIFFTFLFLLNVMAWLLRMDISGIDLALLLHLTFISQSFILMSSLTGLHIIWLGSVWE